MLIFSSACCALLLERKCILGSTNFDVFSIQSIHSLNGSIEDDYLARAITAQLCSFNLCSFLLFQSWCCCCFLICLLLLTCPKLPKLSGSLFLLFCTLHRSFGFKNCKANLPPSLAVWPWCASFYHPKPKSVNCLVQLFVLATAEKCTRHTLYSWMVFGQERTWSYMKMMSRGCSKGSPAVVNQLVGDGWQQ